MMVKCLPYNFVVLGSTQVYVDVLNLNLIFLLS